MTRGGEGQSRRCRRRRQRTLFSFLHRTVWNFVWYVTTISASAALPGTELAGRRCASTKTAFGSRQSVISKSGHVGDTTAINRRGLRRRQRGTHNRDGLLALRLLLYIVRQNGIAFHEEKHHRVSNQAAPIANPPSVFDHRA